jgi:AcrR family transcriptional regulator
MSEKSAYHAAMAPITSARRPATGEKRELLLDAAIELFRGKGLHDTTVEEIARRAGVAKGTFYLYFQTKEDLVDELRVEFAQQLEALLTAAVPPPHTSGWPDFVSHLVDNAAGLFVEQRDLHDLLAALPHAHDPGPLGEAMTAAQRALVDILHAGVSDGALDVVDADATAWLLLDLIQAAGDRASAAPASAGRFRRACANAAVRWLVRRAP